MAKHKKKHSKKAATATTDIFDTAAMSIRQFRKVTKEINKLSTGQKLVGGFTLLVGGLFYLNKLRQESGGASHGFHFHLPQLTSAYGVSAENADEEEDADFEEVPGFRKSRKGAKHGKSPDSGSPKPTVTSADL